MVQGKVWLTGCASEDTQKRVFDILDAMHIEHEMRLLEPGRVADFCHCNPCIAVVDDIASPQQIHELVAGEKLYDLLVCHKAVVEQAPQILAKSLDFFVLSQNDRELAARLERRISACARAEPTDADVDPKLRQNMIGSALAFVDILKTIQRCAKVDVPVLINGETGTGKELAARALHYGGPRRAGPFQALNCGAVPDLLVENELFGHIRGAYTDARSTQPGLVELASGGTLFLDEVDALSYKAQTALLRFIQDGTYRELGGGTDKQADVRVVSASNKNLATLAPAGKFRQDLMYRLNTLIVDMPPLRERREDIPALVRHFLQTSEKEFSLGPKHFHPQGIMDIISYGWPGNIRELENFVRRAYLLTDGQVIFQSPDKCSELSPAGDGSARRCNGSQPAVVPFSDAKRLAVDYFESSYIAQLLRTTGGNLSRAAQLAGKERRAFSRLVKKHGIVRSDF